VRAADLSTQHFESQYTQASLLARTGLAGLSLLLLNLPKMLILPEQHNLQTTAEIKN